MPTMTGLRWLASLFLMGLGGVLVMMGLGGVPSIIKVSTFVIFVPFVV